MKSIWSEGNNKKKACVMKTNNLNKNGLTCFNKPYLLWM